MRVLFLEQCWRTVIASWDCWAAGEWARSIAPTVWYTSAAFFPVVIMLALAIYGFYTSLGGQTVFKSGLLRE